MQHDGPGVDYPARPHRGALILVLGIVGLVMCVICGIIAWVLGAGDLREMREGNMDRAGEGLTKAGMILGIISVCLNVLAIILYVALIMLGLIAGAAANP